MPLSGVAIGIIALASVVVLTLIVGFAIFWHILKADLLNQERKAESAENPPKVKLRKRKSSRRSAGGPASRNGMHANPTSVPVRLGAPTTVQDANGEDPIISFYEDGNEPLSLGAMHGLNVQQPPQNTNRLPNVGFDPHQRYLDESPTRLGGGAPQAGTGGPLALVSLPAPTRIGRAEHEVIRRNSAGKRKDHDDRLSWESVRSVEDNAQLASLAKMRVMADRQQEDATKNPQRVIDRKFSRSSIGQQLLVQRDETELTMILSDYAMSPTTQDQLYEDALQNAPQATTWTEAGTGATTRQGSVSPRRGLQSRASNRDSVGTPYGFGSASEADTDSDDSNSLDGFGAEDPELQRMSRNLEPIGTNANDFNGELNNIETNFAQRTTRPVAPNPDSSNGF